MNGREFNLGLLTKYEYGSRNLKPKPGTRPAACFKVRSPHKWEWLYREEDLETANPNLPAIYPSHALVPPHLKTQNQLKQIGLKPKDNAKPHACLWWATDWLFFYHQDECVAREAEYVCKSNLRTYYFLSKTWISRLGAPDLEIENPHGRKFAPMQLYNKQRIFEFLAERAEEYAQWLERRQKYVAIFAVNRERIAAGQKTYLEFRETGRQERRVEQELHSSTGLEDRSALRTQSINCLRCASAYVGDCGFLCAIHEQRVIEHSMSRFYSQDFIERVALRSSNNYGFAALQTA
jgi:hypothetical protein